MLRKKLYTNVPHWPFIIALKENSTYCNQRDRTNGKLYPISGFQAYVSGEKKNIVTASLTHGNIASKKRNNDKEHHNSSFHCPWGRKKKKRNKKIDTNPWVELTLENQLAREGCPKHICTWLSLHLSHVGNLDCNIPPSSWPTTMMAHSINTDLMVALFLFGGSTHLSVIQWLNKIF